MEAWRPGVEGNEAGFKAWMAKVDAVVSARSGLSADDLPDCCYRDWYDDGVKPAAAAARAIRMAD